MTSWYCTCTSGGSRGQARAHRRTKMLAWLLSLFTAAAQQTHGRLLPWWSVKPLCIMVLCDTPPVARTEECGFHTRALDCLLHSMERQGESSTRSEYNIHRCCHSHKECLHDIAKRLAAEHERQASEPQVSFHVGLGAGLI